MKIRPEQLLIKNQDINYKKILVTGSDEALINYVTKFLIKKFEKKNFYLEKSNDLESGLIGDLFSDKKILFLLNNIPTKKTLSKFQEKSENAFLISSPNNKKITDIKKMFMFFYINAAIISVNFLTIHKNIFNV